MEKVFIVSVSLCLAGGKREKVILNVFTSFRKAKVYADYKNLQIARKGVSIFQVPGACPVECAVVILEQQSICSIDWSDDLKELQDEKL